MNQTWSDSRGLTVPCVLYRASSHLLTLVSSLTLLACWDSWPWHTKTLALQIMWMKRHLCQVMLPTHLDSRKHQRQFNCPNALRMLQICSECTSRMDYFWYDSLWSIHQLHVQYQCVRVVWLTVGHTPAPCPIPMCTCCLTHCGAYTSTMSNTNVYML